MNETDLLLPSHSCNQIADFSAYMQGEERTMWLGEITDPPDGYDQERWCLHIKTPEKPPMEFGLNRGDLEFLTCLSQAALGEIPVERWRERIVETAKSHAEQ